MSSERMNLVEKANAVCRAEPGRAAEWEERSALHPGEEDPVLIWSWHASHFIDAFCKWMSAENSRDLNDALYGLADKEPGTIAKLASMMQHSNQFNVPPQPTQIQHDVPWPGHDLWYSYEKRGLQMTERPPERCGFSVVGHCYTPFRGV